MKKENPEKVCEIVEKYIISPKEPVRLVQKRAPKKREVGSGIHSNLNKEQMLLILENSLENENLEIIKFFVTERFVKAVRAEFIASVYSNEPNHELWKKYNLLLNASKAQSK